MTSNHGRGKDTFVPLGDKGNSEVSITLEASAKLLPYSLERLVKLQACL